MRRRARVCACVAAMAIECIALLWTTAPAQAAAPSLVSTTRTNGGNYSVTFNRPAGTSAGDLLVAIVGSDDWNCGGLSIITAPSGWNLLRRATQSNGRVTAIEVHWRIAGASEPSSYEFTSAVQSSLCWFAALPQGSISRITGSHQTSPFSTSAATSSGANATTVDAPSISTSSLMSRVMLIGWHDQENATPQAMTTPSGYTYSTEGIVGTGVSPKYRMLVASRMEPLPTSVPGSSIALVGNGPTAAVGLQLAIRPPNPVAVTGTATNVDGTVWRGCKGAGTPTLKLAVGAYELRNVGCNAATGAWSTSLPVTAGETVTTWLADPSFPGDRATTYVRAADGTSAISGVDVGVGAVRLTDIAAADDISVFDEDQDAAIPIRVSGAGIVVANDARLEVNSGQFMTRYASANRVLTTPKIQTSGTGSLVAYGSADLSVTLTGSGTSSCSDPVSSRPMCVTTGSTPAAMNVTYTGTSTTAIDGAPLYKNLSLQPASGTPTYALGSSDDATVSISGSLTIGGSISRSVTADTTMFNPTVDVGNVVTINAGSVLSGSGSNQFTTVDGVTGAGDINLTDGTFAFHNAMGAPTFDGGTSATPWRFHDLSIAITSFTGYGITLNGTRPIEARDLIIGSWSVAGGSIDLDVPTAELRVQRDLRIDFGRLATPPLMSIGRHLTFDYSGADLTPSGATSIVRFNGGATSRVTGPVDVAFSTLQVTNGTRLELQAGRTTSVTSHLQAIGSGCGTEAIIASTTPSVRATLNVAGSHALDYLGISDIEAGAALTVIHGGDLGNNSANISFGDGQCTAPDTIRVGTTTTAGASANPLDINGAADFRTSTRNRIGAVVDRAAVRVLTTPLATDISALWPLDGSFSDSAGVAGPLSASPASPSFTARSAPFVGSAATFDGVDDGLISAASTVHAASSFTAETWIKSPGPGSGSESTILELQSSSTGRQLRMWVSGGLVRAGITAAGVAYETSTFAVPVLDDEWHHVAMVVDGGARTISLYVDGLLRGVPTTFLGVADTPAAALRVGNGSSGTSPFRGSIDDVRIVKRAIPSNEIRGYVATGRAHATEVWSIGAAGTPITACGSMARCDDIRYTGASIDHDGARWYVQHRVRTRAGLWSSWSDPDWFVTSPAITISATDDLSVPATSPGTDVAFAPTQLTTSCPASAACDVYLQSTSSSASLTSSTGAVIPPFAATTPTLWPAGGSPGFGIAILNHPDWGAASSPTDYTQLRYVGPRASPIRLMTLAAGSSAVIDLTARVTTPASQAPGTYDGVIVVFVAAAP